MTDNLDIHKQKQRFLFIDMNVIKQLIQKICNLFSKHTDNVSTHL